MNLRVVIVDDSNLVRERLVKMLGAVPNLEIVGEAANSQDALEVFRDQKPHIVIVDIKIPGENGIEVLKKIKKINQAVIVIIITNYPFTQYRTKCLENGADYFFDKSNEYSEVIRTIENMVNSRFIENTASSW
ncbi:MAG: response regulator transcription factor [Ignavibacteriaceae bacterium]|nr:response regulator transcription factor [Ignavibacteria bacterium]NNL20410.1 response regulator transcription factor [Ignavibacteriaceae bacterium]